MYNNGYQQRQQWNEGNNRPNSAAKEDFKPLEKTTYVKQAEDIIKNKISRNKGNKINLKTNQIRIILDLINEVYIPVKNAKSKELNEDVKSKLQYIKMKIAYQAGREKDVMDFVNKSNIMKYIDEVKTKDDLVLLAHYTEALVAYHKFYGED